MLSKIKQVAFVSLLCAAFAIAGCQPALNEGVYKGEELPADKSNELRDLNVAFLSAIKTDRDDAELLCSKEFLEQKKTKVKFDYVNKLRSEDEYVLLQDYYIVNSENEDGLVAFDHPEVKYVPLTKEMYLAFFVPKHNQNKTMLTIVYGKYDIGWKANEISLGYYTQLGKTAQQLFEAAKEEYARGYCVNAINYVVMATNTKPSKYLKNPQAEQLSAFSKKIIDEANAKVSYPLTLKDVTTAPNIISIWHNAKEDELLQYVYYITKLKISDTTALKRENDQIKKVLPKIFPGIDKGEKTIVYMAMNRKPIVGESIPHVDFEQKIKN